jgi:Peroxidase
MKAALCLLLARLAATTAACQLPAAYRCHRVETRLLSLETAATRVHDDESSTPSRRSFLSSGAAALATTSAVAAAFGVPLSPVLAAPASVDYKAVAKDIGSLIEQDPNKGPTLVRLAWHSSGTYDKMANDGGSGPGTIRFKEELAHGGNAGLGETAVPWLEPIRTKYADSGLSYADLYTLAGGTLLRDFVRSIDPQPLVVHPLSAIPVCCGTNLAVL